MPGNCPFDQRQFTAAETGAFTCRVVVGPARGLPGIDRERRAVERTAQRLTELGIGNQAETTGQAITGQFDDVALLAQAHSFQPFITQGGHDVGAGAVMTIKQAKRLHKLARPARQLQGEPGDCGGRGLLGNAQYLGTAVFRGGRAGQ